MKNMKIYWILFAAAVVIALAWYFILKPKAAEE